MWHAAIIIGHYYGISWVKFLINSRVPKGLLPSPISGASQGLCGALPRLRQRTGDDLPGAALLGRGNTSSHRGAQRPGRAMSEVTGITYDYWDYIYIINYIDINKHINE